MNKMRNRNRDYQRKRVYDAENWAETSIYTLPESLEWVTKTIHSWIADPRFIERYGEVKQVTIMPGKGARRCSMRVTPEEGHLKLCFPKHGRHPMVLAHELAHYCSDTGWSHNIAWHGIEFCSDYLWLVETFVGKEEALLLKEAFDHYGVEYTNMSTQKFNYDAAVVHA